MNGENLSDTLQETIWIRILPSVSLSRFERVAISLGMDPPRGLPTGGQELKSQTGSDPDS
jgi:hypothetical protein